MYKKKLLCLLISIAMIMSSSIVCSAESIKINDAKNIMYFNDNNGELIKVVAK
ncbi:hypothetical protein DFR58_13635 [Anaerobacterium chartisolvens]|uniref:Uncharacterized protein n=1 Tax=Anaerobacterium chartisolvens TaxID=1297424 RepID=A0A369AIY5_9FIRM|nr:hypothetical protein [Anaerobacterium chartisolvens]RCX09359.1 hypothetical protein DFR58_13635 [Anaerobacterium chartisolvens]